MLEADRELAESIEKKLRASVTHTISILFNVTVDVDGSSGEAPAPDDYVCCGELIQDQARATLMFSFDRALIQMLADLIFPPNNRTAPGVCEATATEIVNIVGNELKTHLNLQGYKLRAGIPYVLDQKETVAKENPLIHLAFSLKNDPAMGVDFFLRSA
jgi:hypothetical protein